MGEQAKAKTKKPGDTTTQDNHIPSEPAEETTPTVETQAGPSSKDDPILKPQDNHIP
ncbi:hypothetical protein [Streptomyces apocyni]|uniref:hypothetical protein n=1 Tax=Streptomyces apocyni TaxID=2654677 RepID=UPI0012E9C7BF|nr:hypothetical protein [Streptomyces apocyni]